MTRLNAYQSPNAELNRELKAAESAIFSDMHNISLSDLNISETIRKRLKYYVQNLRPSLFTYISVMGAALSESQKPFADMVFIEYGGGTGFLSLLARKLGIGTIIYNDINEVSCKDAKEIARTLGCLADYYVLGDIDELVGFCGEHGIKSDILVSNDVLEHIYDLNDYCSKLTSLSKVGTVMVQTSGANMFFYPCVKRLSRTQINVEIRGRSWQFGTDERACLLAYFGERQRIIAQYNRNLNENEVERLAKATRGLRREDIIKAVGHYIHDKEMPATIEHPTNTCNPYTGGWCEHLVNFYYLVE